MDITITPTENSGISRRLQISVPVATVTEFEDKAALDAYASHPTHKALVPFIGAIREARQCMDYEV